MQCDTRNIVAQTSHASQQLVLQSILCSKLYSFPIPRSATALIDGFPMTSMRTTGSLMKTSASSCGSISVDKLD